MSSQHDHPNERHHHHHRHRDRIGDLPARQARTVIYAAVCCVASVAATLIALIVTGPTAQTAGPEHHNDPIRSAVVVSRTLQPCGEDTCVAVVAETKSDDDKASEIADLGVVPAASPLGRQDVGSSIVVSGSGPVWYFVDIERRPAMFAIVALFTVVVVILGRLRGVLSLAALASSVAILALFAIPAILAGYNALGVCLAAATLIAVAGSLVTLGPTPVAIVATTGTLGALAVAWVSAEAFTRAAQLTGVVGDNIGALTSLVPGVDLRGLFLGGVVLGALGALDDITVTQASTVAELDVAGGRQANATALYRSAMRVGRDHVGAAVNTLALAYVGGALPLLVLFAAGGGGASNMVNSEIVALEIVRTLAGSMGLVAAIPATTAFAAWVAAAGRTNSNGTDQREPPGSPTAPST